MHIFLTVKYTRVIPKTCGYVKDPNNNEYIIPPVNGFYSEFSGDYDKIGWTPDLETNELAPNSYFSVAKAYENENNYAFVLHDNKWYLIEPYIWEAIRSNGAETHYEYNYDWRMASILVQNDTNIVESPTFVSKWTTDMHGKLATVEITL